MSDLDPIVPDDKNWTWVLDRPCPECGFDASQHPKEQLGADIRTNAAQWRTLLTAGNAARRPEPTQWSALEYGCHVRDVFLLFLERLNLMLKQDDPTFANWDQDVTAVAERYDLQDPSVVAAELAQASEAMAAAFDAVSGDEWERTGVRGDGARFTVDSFSRYFLHDIEHHLWDVTGRAAGSWL